MEEGEEGGKGDVDEFLDSNFGKELVLPESAEFYKSRKNKIEKLGKEVMKSVFELVQTTDLTYGAIAKKINEIYGLSGPGAVNKQNVIHFFRSNGDVLGKLAEEKCTLNKMRASLYLEHNGVLVNDIKVLDAEINKVIEDDMLESDRRAKAVADLIDKKGRLLLRHAKLSGKLNDVQTATQINIYNKVENEKSELIQRLKKAEFREKEIEAAVSKP